MVAVPWRALAPVKTPITVHRILADASSFVDKSNELLTALKLRSGTQYGLLVDSGTSALRLAIAAAVPKSKYVALPAFGCFDLLTAAHGANRDVVFYDLDPATLAPDIDSLKASITEDTAAVVIASLFGYPPEMDEVLRICSEAGVPLIEDIAQASGATFRHRALGTWGSFVTMSFGRGKGIGGGGGGAILTREALNSALSVEATPTAHTLGITASLLAQRVLGHPSLYAIPSSLPMLRLGESLYHDPWPATSIHPMQLRLAHAGIIAADSAAAARRLCASRIVSTIGERSGFRFTKTLPDAMPGFLRVGARLSGTVGNKLRRLGVRRSYPTILPEHPSLRGGRSSVGSYIGSHELARQLVTLPCHDDVRTDDVARLHELLDHQVP